MSERPLVVITQPYVAAYRVPLFESLRDKLANAGVDLVVASGRARGDQALRDDEHAPLWSTELAEHAVRLGSRRLTWRRVALPRRPDLVVSELEALNLFAWKTLLSRTKIVLWGHGKPYVNDSPRIAERLEWFLARRATRVMTYSDGGRDYLIAEGRLNPVLVTAVGNSTDTEALRKSWRAVDPDKVRELRTQFGAGPIAMFVGGLDASKRIDFLLEAASVAHAADPGFRLIVVGKGAQVDKVSRATRSGGYVTHIPVARGAELAELSHVADAMWIPGRVGLVAVDSLALGLPVLTTRFRYHAPEIEFLREGEVHFLPDNAAQFGRDGLALMKRAPADTPPLRDDIPTIERVASKLSEVLLEALASSRRQEGPL